MTRRKSFLGLAIATAVAMAGCGQSGNADRASGGGGEVVVPADTRLYIALDHNIDSNKVKVGDMSSGTLKMPVVVDGKDVIPAGTKFNLRVTNVNRAQNAGQQGLVTVAVDSFDHNGRKTGMQVTQITAQGQPLPAGTDPKAPAAGLPLREDQAVSNAVLTAGHTMDFRTTEPYRFRP